MYIWINSQVKAVANKLYYEFVKFPRRGIIATSSVLSMTIYRSSQWHIAANGRSEEGGNGCRNVNKLVNKACKNL